MQYCIQNIASDFNESVVKRIRYFGKSQNLVSALKDSYFALWNGMEWKNFI